MIQEEPDTTYQQYSIDSTTCNGFQAHYFARPITCKGFLISLLARVLNLIICKGSEAHYLQGQVLARVLNLITCKGSETHYLQGPLVLRPITC